MKFIMILFLSSFVVAGEKASWVFPWVANRDNQWATDLILTNHEFEAVDVVLRAVRASGEEQAVTKHLNAKETLMVKASDLFDQLGSGAGYAVFMTSDHSKLEGDFLLWSLNNTDHASPTCGKALNLNSGQYQWSLDTLSRQNTFYSAVVLINTAEKAGEVEWDAFSTLRQGNLKARNSVMVEPMKPKVLVLDEMLPQENDMVRLELNSENPILVLGFIFSPQKEPVVVEALERFGFPENLRPLQDSDFPEENTAKETLGRFLYWDKLISGNENISCGSCHHTMAGTGDGLSLPIGEGGHGLGISRDTGSQMDAVEERVPRNAPPVFNLGAKGFDVFFHDGRVARNSESPKGFDTPAGDDLLSGLESGLAAQAMFPVTSSAEMRGQVGENDIADAPSNGDVWALLTARVMGIDDYQNLFRAAYPGLSVPEDVTFAHIANAIGAYEANTFRANKTAFDRFLLGETSALSWDQKRGMSLFYGKAQCSTCHSGVHMTDQEFHVLGVPPIGPGKGDGLDGHDDFGREKVTNNEADRYAFRTPPLRNVALTGPWGHTGAFDTLEGIVRHHLNPIQSLENYDPKEAVLPSRSDLDERDFIILNDEASMMSLEERIELGSIELNDREVADIIAFLGSLTDPQSLDMRAAFPRAVPSGLPVFD